MSELMFSSVSSVDHVNRKNGVEKYAESSGKSRKAENSSEEIRETEQYVQEHRGYPISDVQLKFELNQETDQLTVFVVDKNSRSVIRTIPPEEISKMDVGELLEIAA